jgi:hypothetical protein
MERDEPRLFQRRVTLLVGHFGSGKTEIALNGALDLAAADIPVSLVDLDVVKPYFRSRAARQLLAERGVDLVAPEGESHHADLPIIVPRIRKLLRSSETRVIMDVGGDDSGARVLGSLADVMPTDETEVLLVLNFRRPFTRDPGEAEVMVREIETAARVAVTGLVSNTHLMGETTPEIVLEGLAMAEETGRRLDLPVVAVAVEAGTASGLPRADLACQIFELQRIIIPPVERQQKAPTTGPLFVLN